MRFRKRSELALLFRGVFAHKGWLAAAFFFILVGSAATWMEPRLLAWLIDEGLVARDATRLGQWTLILAATLGARVVATVLQSYCSEVLGQRLSFRLRQRVFARILKLPQSRIDEEAGGRWMTRATHDVNAIAEMFSGGLLSVVTQVLTVVGVACWVVALSPDLGVLALAGFPPILFATYLFTRRLHASYRETRSRLSSLNSSLAEGLLGVRTLQLFNRVDRVLERLGRLNQRYTEAQFGVVKVYAFFQPMITLAAGITVAVVVWAGARSASRGEIPLGVLTAYFSYVMALFQPLREIADKWNVFLSGFASLERIAEILAIPQEPKGGSRGHAGERLGTIEFCSVWFAYKDEDWVLRDFSARVEPGEFVGIVGHTGSGKSTLVSLLLRFYDVSRGAILVDGVDIREWNLAELRRRFGFIQQEAGQFSATPFENATFWGTIAKEPIEIDAALREMGANNPDEIHSAGEKQVVAFARAWAFEPEVFILDEATAHLDSTTESRAMAFLRSRAHGRSVLAIAHRLATVQDADKIWVLHQGRLAEAGTSAELIAQQGLYAKLRRYQDLGGPGRNHTV